MDEAALAHPDSWWWIKADGVDVVSGLGVSVSGRWSGDVDLGDGALDNLRQTFHTQIQLVKSMGVPNREAESLALEDLKEIQKITLEDIDFISQRN